MEEVKDYKAVPDIEEFLAESGVPGMKWGIRRRGDTSSSSGGGSHASTQGHATGSAPAKADDGPSDDHKKATSIKKKKLSELSNAEIATLAARIELEAKYSAITATQKDKTKKALEDMVRNKAIEAGGVLIGGVLNKQASVLAGMVNAEADKFFGQLLNGGGAAVASTAAQAIAANAKP